MIFMDDLGWIAQKLPQDISISGRICPEGSLGTDFAFNWAIKES